MKNNIIFLSLFTLLIPLVLILDPPHKFGQKTATDIKQSTFEKELAYIKHYYLFAKQDLPDLSVLEKDIMTRVNETKLISDYAKKNNLSVSSEETQAYFESKLVNKSESDELSKIEEMYGMNKEDYLTKLSEELLREKVQSHLKIPLADWLKVANYP